MILQHFTKTRPSLDVPFFEDSTEGKSRSDAIIQLAIDHPELVVSRETDPTPATELTWSGTWTFPGWTEFKAFMQLSHDADTTLRADRAKYIMRNGQEMLVESQDAESTQRNVQVHITSNRVLRHDGSVMTTSDISSL
jgi:hypothetical protein